MVPIIGSSGEGAPMGACRGSGRSLRRMCTVALAVSPLLAVPLLASGGGQSGYFNYATSTYCNWLQSYVSGSGQFAASGVTQSYSGNCLGMTTPVPPLALSNRAPNQIGVRWELRRNGAACTAIAWNYNTTTTSIVAKSVQWAPGVVPCGGGASFRTDTFGKVLALNGTGWKPNVDGTPGNPSPVANW
jgi:hypothetical protein